MIADDHPATRLGVRIALIRGGFRVLAEAADRDGAISSVRRERPDVCLLDVHMPGGGIEAAATLAAVAPATAVVMLTASGSGRELVAALRAGAAGFLLKETRSERLPAALRCVLAGEPALPPELLGDLVRVLRTSSAAKPEPPPQAERHPVSLTRRESQVMRMLDSGLATAEIGASLSLSPVTIRRHISAAAAKLGVEDRREALRMLTSGRG